MRSAGSYHPIDCYRLAYSDWAARPLGIADVLNGVVVLELVGDVKMPHHSGLVASRFAADTRKMPVDPGKLMRELLTRSAPPFIPVAVTELRKARLYGQYRELVIWAGTIVTNVIEEILLSGLRRESPEYRRLKNSGKDVSGATRRGEFFKKATGETLREWLKGREAIGHSSQGLADQVEALLDLRNQLLHRKAAVMPEDSERAFDACMGFLAAVENVPFWKEEYPYEF